MFYLILALFLTIVGIRVIYDFWSTWKIKRGPDEEIDTKDDGKETNPYMNWVMSKIGVFKTLLLTKSVELVFYVAVFVGYLYKVIPGEMAAAIYFVYLAFAVYLFMRYNFKYDGIGKR